MIEKAVVIILLSGCLNSCQFHTAISYRADPAQEYCKQEGYMLSCNKNGESLVVGTYTPDSWGKEFYYGYLQGIKSSRNVKILGTKLKFLDTGDTLTLKEIRNNREYIFSSSDIGRIIDHNKRLLLTVILKNNNDTTTIEKSFLLLRYKHTYPTGAFPHS